MNLSLKSKPISSVLSGAALLVVSLNATALAITEVEDPVNLANFLLGGISGISNIGATLNRGDPGFPIDTTSGASFLIDEEGPFEDAPVEIVDGPQTGTYTNAANTYGLPGPGIVMSTGLVRDYGTGPNTVDELTSFFGRAATQAQNDILTPLSGELSHFDPIALSISFDASGIDNITFFASFGSEEFPEFVGDGVNDAFALLAGSTNVAGALPTAGQPGDPLLPVAIDNPDMSPIAGTELDGVLAPNGIPVLRFDIPVDPGANNFTLLLADTDDGEVDTTIYLTSEPFVPNDGGSEFTPLLPSNPEAPGDGFVFELPPVTAGNIIWFDPVVAVGYTYEATGGGIFASFTAPLITTVPDPDGYFVSFDDGTGPSTLSVLGGETVSLGLGVTEFELTGIAPILLLDPTDPVAFAAGLSFTGSGTGFGVVQTPIEQFVPESVPEPSTLGILGLGLTGLFGLRRRNKT